jgi:hypothetical protein
VTKLLAHVKHNAIAYLALFVALGGTSYAAIKIPNNSVGSNQLRNGAVTSKKLASSSIRGYVAMWAKLSVGGQITASSPHATVLAIGRGVNQVFWHQPISAKCSAVASEMTVLTQSGWANAVLSSGGPHPKSASAIIQTFDNTGASVPAPASVVVICP